MSELSFYYCRGKRDSIYSPQSPERVVLLAVRVPNFDVDSFGLFVVPSVYSCSVLHEVHWFVDWPQSPNFVPGRLARCPRSQSRRERTEIVGIDVFLKKKEVINGGQLFIWIYTTSCTLYSHQGHERFSVLSRGRSAMLFHNNNNNNNNNNDNNNNTTTTNNSNTKRFRSISHSLNALIL